MDAFYALDVGETLTNESHSLLRISGTQNHSENYDYLIIIELDYHRMLEYNFEDVLEPRKYFGYHSASSTIETQTI